MHEALHFNFDVKDLLGCATGDQYVSGVYCLTWPTFSPGQRARLTLKTYTAFKDARTGSREIQYSSHRLL